MRSTGPVSETYIQPLRYRATPCTGSEWANYARYYDANARLHVGVIQRTAKVFVGVAGALSFSGTNIAPSLEFSNKQTWKKFQKVVKIASRSHCLSVIVIQAQGCVARAVCWVHRGRYCQVWCLHVSVYVCFFVEYLLLCVLEFKLMHPFGFVLQCA